MHRRCELPLERTRDLEKVFLRLGFYKQCRRAEYLFVQIGCLQKLDRCRFENRRIYRETRQLTIFFFKMIGDLAGALSTRIVIALPNPTGEQRRGRRI